MDESVYMCRHDDDDVSVMDDNPFAGRQNRSPVRPSQRWEQGFKVEIQNSMEKISNWVKFKKHIRAAFLPYNFERDLYQQFQNLRQGSRSVDEYSIEFYTFLARVDLNESPIQLLAWRGTGSFRQPANSTSGTSSLSQPARETSAQPTPQPARGSVAPLQGRTGGLRCFNCGEVGHRQVDYQNLKSSNRGLFTEANESKFVLIIYSTQTYDDYADTDEEYVSGDVGPLLVLCRSCLTRRAPNDEWLRNNLFHSTCTIGGKVCTFIIDAGSCENVISEVVVSKLSLSTEPHPKPYRLSWLSQGLSPQPQALETTFEARVRDYMAAHTERMKRFENTIFKQHEEINGRMTEMFGLLKELTTSKTSEKVLIREEAKFAVTKNVNSISLAKGEKKGVTGRR
ncbi:putative reverse transcriptase domain-containing protein [Tanacetum coccineum]